MKKYIKPGVRVYKVQTHDIVAASPVLPELTTEESNESECYTKEEKTVGIWDLY